MNVQNEQARENVFSKNAAEQAAVASKIKISSYLSRRLDLRGKTILAFASSEGEKPSQAAISVYKTENGWQLGIHVADVAEYVCEGSPLDIEARARHASLRNEYSESDMLPEGLAYGICSLRAGADRLALSVLLDIDSKGALISAAFEESVIRVSEKCIYEEIDQYGLASDTSSVFALRDKYMPYTSILADMYELAAVLYTSRLERGALDCTVYRRKFERDENGKPISFSLRAEPDSHAMVRELGYYAATAVGSYMYSHGLPCIFIGQGSIDDYAEKYLCEILGMDNGCACHFKTSEIIKNAKGSPYYDFVSEALFQGLPCAEYSTQPIYNLHCASDKVVAFLHPVSRYTDLLAHRAIKASIAASGNPSNLNLNRHRATAEAAADEANNAEKYIYDAKIRYRKLSALEFIAENADSVFEGFPLLRDESGAIPVLLTCGAKALITSESAKDYRFTAGTVASFKIVAFGTENEAVIVEPI